MTKPKIKSELVCKGCGATWANPEGKTRMPCPYCGRMKDSRIRSDYSKSHPRAGERKECLKKWYADPDNRKKRGAEQRVLLRKRVLFKIGGSVPARCVRCGCDDYRLLEINHKNGGGTSERDYVGKIQAFYWNIIKGRRPTDDLEILCRPCNSIHWLELKYGPLPMRVVWDGTPPPVEKASD